LVSGVVVVVSSVILDYPSQDATTPKAKACCRMSDSTASSATATATGLDELMPQFALSGNCFFNERVCVGPFHSMAAETETSLYCLLLKP
jgi:hypothetical protein